MKQTPIYLYMSLVVCLMSSNSFGQTVGDGIPDLYYYHGDNVFFTTSAGSITRPFGTILLDTDGSDVVAVLFDAPDLITSCTSPGYLCEPTNHLPDPNAGTPPFDFSSWVYGYINNRSQWVRNDPLDTLGFVGVIGEAPDPNDLYPDFGLAYYDGGGGDFSAFGAVRFARNDGAVVTLPDFCAATDCVADPDTTNDAYTVSRGLSLNTTTAGLPTVLSNDMSRMGVPTLTASIETPPSHGTLSLATDGSFVYTHNGSSLMPDSFTYRAMDSVLGSPYPSLATVTINVELPDCDFDDDNDCDLVDIDNLVMEIVAGTDNLAFDLNGDNDVGLLDRDAWLAQAGAMNLVTGNPYLLGDANLSGSVNIVDYGAWLQNNGQTTGKWSKADFNASGSTNIVDYGIWLQHNGQSSAPAVPEPCFGIAGILTLFFLSRDARRGIG